MEYATPRGATDDVPGMTGNDDEMVAAEARGANDDVDDAQRMLDTAVTRTAAVMLLSVMI